MPWQRCIASDVQKLLTVGFRRCARSLVKSAFDDTSTVDNFALLHQGAQAKDVYIHRNQMEGLQIGEGLGPSTASGLWVDFGRFPHLSIQSLQLKSRPQAL